jgi:hypothetical protein
MNAEFENRQGYSQLYESFIDLATEAVRTLSKLGKT